MRLQNQPAFTTIGTILLLGAGAAASPAHAQGFADNSTYYEEDGLLDITEWFDGNDYNPTDEAAWRWDDEIYNAYEDTGGDTDGDNDGDWYGYDDANDDDWYYDYYDPYSRVIDYDPIGADMYDFGTQYYDYDGDGLYDAMSTYSDSDHDGEYDDYDYYSFNNTTSITRTTASDDQTRATESTHRARTGTIQMVKRVQVRDGVEHLVVAIKPESAQNQRDRQNQHLIADLGNVDDLSGAEPREGDRITVTGPRVAVGDKRVVLARSFEIDGRKTQISRDPRSVSGEVISTRQIVVRGNEHLLAMVQTDRNDKAHNVAVDLGPADALPVNIQEGTNLTFTGVPVKITVGGEPKPICVARSVTVNGRVVQIDRQQDNPSASAEQREP